MPDEDIIKKFGPKKRSPWKSPRKSGGRVFRGWLQMYLPAVIFVIVAIGVATFVLMRSDSRDVAEDTIVQEVIPLEESLPVNESASTSVEEEIAKEPEPVVIVTDTPIGYLNVRSGPGIGFTRINRIDPGSVYPFIEESGGWFHIQLDDEEDGWIIDTYASLSMQGAPLKE